MFIKFLLLALFVPVSLLGMNPQETGADHKACAHPTLPMPRTVVIRPDIPSGVEVWREAIAEINRESGGKVEFVEVPQDSEADVYILGSWHAPNPAHREMSRVEMPCGRIESEVYVADDGVDWKKWAVHELMHTLGFADHITNRHNEAWFVSPKICDDSSDDYVGIMSYCSQKWQWWGADDDNLFWWWF